MKFMTNLSFSEMNTRMRQSLVANELACTGCRTCEAVCSLIKIGHICPDNARLFIDRQPFEGLFKPNVCKQCSVPYCLIACPVEAIGVSPKNGTLVIDQGKCNGCGLCQKACPYDMITFDGEQKKAFKCDLCGGNPQCVRVCPMNALGVAYFGDREKR